MSVLAALNTISITPAEQAAVQALLASGAGAGGIAYEDATGTVQRILNDLTKIKADLNVLASNMPAAVSCTFTNSSANITGTGFTFVVGQGVQFTGTLPTGFSTATTYYVVSASSTTIQVSATVGGSAISAASAGTAPWTVRGANAINLAAVVSGLA